MEDLNTETFILSLRPFISRRGRPKTLYSNNDKTFAGANNQLKTLANFLKSNHAALSERSQQLGITWISCISEAFGRLG